MTQPFATNGDRAGHGTLARFHDGCRCGWCVSRCWERLCLCKACVDLRAKSPYIEIPEGLPTWATPRLRSQAPRK